MSRHALLTALAVLLPATLPLLAAGAVNWPVDFTSSDSVPGFLRNTPPEMFFA